MTRGGGQILAMIGTDWLLDPSRPKPTGGYPWAFAGRPHDITPIASNRSVGNSNQGISDRRQDAASQRSHNEQPKL
jgi:hypothetical protein